MLQGLGSNLYSNFTMVEGLLGGNNDTHLEIASGWALWINKHSFLKVCALILQLYFRVCAVLIN